MMTFWCTAPPLRGLRVISFWSRFPHLSVPRCTQGGWSVFTEGCSPPFVSPFLVFPCNFVVGEGPLEPLWCPCLGLRFVFQWFPPELMYYLFLSRLVFCFPSFPVIRTSPLLPAFISPLFSHAILLFFLAYTPLFDVRGFF